jgi:hypothetical protein
MIFVPMEEASAFDILSILEIKLENIKDESKLQKIKQDYNKLLFYIKDQLGNDKYKLIISSCEYFELKSANLETFKFVDEAAKDNGIANKAWGANMLRFGKKAKLQQVHFKNTLNEVKN